jgi:hypothetical protein
VWVRADGVMSMGQNGKSSENWRINSTRTKRLTNRQQKGERNAIKIVNKSVSMLYMAKTTQACRQFRALGSGCASNNMDGAFGSATGESDQRVRCKLKRDFDDLMDWGLLCVHSVLAHVMLVTAVALNERSKVLSNMHDSDSLSKLLYEILLSVLGQNPPRQAWAIPRMRSAVDDLQDWKRLGLSNRVDRFFRDDLRMSESSFNLLLAELEAHSLMDVSASSFRAAHDVSRQLMAWLKWWGLMLPTTKLTNLVELVVEL